MKRAYAVLVLVATLLPLGCGSSPTGGEVPVARVNGVALTVAQLDAYLQANLADEIDDDLVRSRLFDAWIDERLILAEAHERRMTIPDESLDFLINDPDYEAAEEDFDVRRERLRNRLMIEMLQGQVLQDIVLPTAEHAEAWIAEQDEEPAGTGRSVELRSLRFDDADRAMAVHRTLRRDRLTYSEAVLQNTEDESQGVATVMEYASLPPEVQGAIEKLKAGWSSKPVDLGGSTYLFQVVRWIEAAPDDRIDAAREEMFAQERRAAWEEFISELRESARIKVYQENLPFEHASP
jgi:hypothetical protein